MIQFFAYEMDATTALLQEDEFHHCIKVLRHQMGDIISISDGKGLSGKALIDKITKREAYLKVLEVTQHAPKDYTLTLVVAPPKNRSRWEWLVEKSVEIGVTDIIPLITQRSERQKVNLTRSSKVLRSAALQSLRPFHPTLHELQQFDKIIDVQSSSVNTVNYIAHYQEENQSLYQLQESSTSACILIGPEGDFTQSEIEAANQKGFLSINISDNRLRTETAAIVACTLLARMIP